MQKNEEIGEKCDVQGVVRGIRQRRREWNRIERTQNRANNNGQQTEHKKTTRKITRKMG